MPWLRSVKRSTASGVIGSQKLGQPEPDSNLVWERNSGASHAAQWYVPSSWQSTYLPDHGRSVPAWRSTLNCSGLSSVRHSSSVFSISAMGPRLGPQRLVEIGDQVVDVFEADGDAHQARPDTRRLQLGRGQAGV